MRLVVDTSVAVAWSVERQANELSIRAGEHVSGHGAIVPSHFHLELANALLVLERGGRLPSDALERAFESYAKMQIDTDYEAVEQVAALVLPLARRHRLTLYDAAYLELALRTELPLATRDRELAAAATSAGASLFEAS